MSEEGVSLGYGDVIDVVNYNEFSNLSPRQLRLGLLAAGVTGAMVDAAISAIPDPVAREATQIDWEYAIIYDRRHPMIDALGKALGMSSAQIDDMWRAASRIA